MKVKMAKLIMCLFTLLPVKKIIVFESFFGKQFSDSPKAIHKFLLENKNEYAYRLIWAVKPGYEDEFIKQNIETVKRGSFKWLVLMARASYWVNNVRVPDWVVKNKKTTYLQTWHGTPLKKLGLDIEKLTMPGIDQATYRKTLVSDTSKWDFLIAQNDYASEKYQSAFNLSADKVKVTGYPRNDFLKNFDVDFVDEMKKEIGISTSKKVILYAPTWKDNNSYEKGSYRSVLDIDLEKMHSVLGSEYVLLIKWHYLISDQIKIPEKFKGFAIKVPQTYDINSYFVISDFLITDYSSVFFDYANLQRPIIFFTPDWETYQNEVRGMYSDIIADLPGIVVDTTTTLIEAIITPTYPSAQFVESYCSQDDGTATERIVSSVIKKHLKES